MMMPQSLQPQHECHTPLGNDDPFGQRGFRLVLELGWVRDGDGDGMGLASAAGTEMGLGCLVSHKIVKAAGDNL